MRTRATVTVSIKMARHPQPPQAVNDDGGYDHDQRRHDVDHAVTFPYSDLAMAQAISAGIALAIIWDICFSVPRQT